MAQKLSRRKLAMYAAERLLDGDERVLDEIAGLLTSERRQREIELLARDIERELAERGTVVATIEAARELSDDDRAMIEGLIRDAAAKSIKDASDSERSGARVSSGNAARSRSGAGAAADANTTAVSDLKARAAERPRPDKSAADPAQIVLKEKLNPSLIGGFKLTTPTGVLDATIIRKLNQLRAKKI